MGQTGVAVDPRSPAFWRRPRALVPVIAWAVLGGLMMRNYQLDPYNPALEGSDAYGHNGPDALRWGIVVSFVELVALFAVLRPWSYDRSWGRALVALAVFTPWVALNFMTVLHVGGVQALHTLWLVVIWFALVALAAVSANNAMHRARDSERAGGA